MASKSYRALAIIVLLAGGYLLSVAAVRTWRAHSGPAVAVHRPVATAPAARPVPGLTDSDLSTYDFLLRETENPRPHRRAPKTRPAMTPTLELDATTAPTTQGEAALPYVYLPQQPVIPLNVARAALDYVGSDPDAELVWASAINDPNLSPSDRSGLIEDLNQTGFADPQNVTPNDLPLIVRRLELIESLAPDAMDETNAAAFAQAYRDLSTLYARAASQLPTDEFGGPIPPTPGLPEGESIVPTSLPFGGE
jgi:hypothetical protein